MSLHYDLRFTFLDPAFSSPFDCTHRIFSYSRRLELLLQTALMVSSLEKGLRKCKIGNEVEAG
jgi:hypothetical protein